MWILAEQVERACVRMDTRRAKMAIYGQAWFTTAVQERARYQLLQHQMLDDQVGLQNRCRL